MRILGPLVVAASLTVASTLAAAAPVVFESGPERVSVVELFTSEGCHSCPPADRWISGLRDDTRLWHKIVPVAFHVTYWDYIGWRDRFGDESYSLRQREHRYLGNVRSVYTPGFVVNGQEWRAWFSRGAVPLAEDRPGTLRARIDNGLVNVQYTPRTAIDGPFEVVVARLGFNLHSDVDAGENSGKRLKHDFVVLGVESGQLAPSGNAYASTVLLPKSKYLSDPGGLAVWVTAPGQQSPIQALGGYLRPE
ncbi:MAG: DUF1223 domain-containing protein [Gammaproteobacteria bacterium]|nr:DUF1223 domain-containing protein [Gammaproteobacteria bacterium]